MSLATDSAGRIYLGFGSNYLGLDLMSPDAGTSWQRSTVLSKQLAASPSVPGNVYGVVDAGHEAGFVAIGRATDGGVTWQTWLPTPAGVDESFFLPGQLAADPQNAEIVYTTFRDVIHRSTDGGHTFASFISFGKAITALAFSTDGTRWWVAARDDTLFVSVNSGESW